MKLKFYSVTSWDNWRCPGDTDGWLTPRSGALTWAPPFARGEGFVTSASPLPSARASVLGLRPLPSLSVLNLPSIHGRFAPSIWATPSNFIFYKLTQYHSVNGACFLCHSPYMYQTLVFYSLDGQPILCSSLSSWGKNRLPNLPKTLPGIVGVYVASRVELVQAVWVPIWYGHTSNSSLIGIDKDLYVIHSHPSVGTHQIHLAQRIHPQHN